MKALRGAWRRIAAFSRRDDIERDLDDELRFHVEQQIEKNIRSGLSPGEARRLALIRFGGLESVKERTRDQFRPALVEDTWRDLRYGLRALRRAPGFTVTAVLTLALGIGATVAVFSVVYGVLLKPLPYPDPERLVALRHRAPGIEGLGSDNLQLSTGQYFTYRDEQRTFEAFGLWSGGSATVIGRGEPEEVRSLAVTSGTLPALGVEPLIGRGFTIGDETPGAPEAIVLMHGYWERRFGSDPTVVGRVITVNARPRTIVGVMPERFRFLNAEADVIACMQLDRSTVLLGGFNFEGVARLRPGVSAAQAADDISRMLGIWLDAWPAPQSVSRQMFESARIAPDLRPLREEVAGDVGGVLWVVMGTIGIVLIIACANVANLLLVRAEGRYQELAVRAALGAAWHRLARELLLESLLLGLLGGSVGLVLAFGALELLVALEPAGLPRLHEISIDRTVLAVTGAVSLLSGLLFGVVPVARHATPRIAPALGSGSRTASGSRARHRTRNALVVVQVGLALVLLVGSVLMIRTFLALRVIDPGLAGINRVQLVRLSIPPAAEKDPVRVLRRQHAIRERIGAISGVSAVSFASAAPMVRSELGADPVYVEGRTYGVGEIPPLRMFKFVAPGFIGAVGTRLLAGRDLTWADVFERRPVALVSQRMARDTWREPDAAIGRRIRESPNGLWREVVGVVADVYDDGLHEPPPPTVYWPVLMEQFWNQPVFMSSAVTFAIRSERTGREGFIAELQRAVWDVDPSLPLTRVRTLADVYEQSLARTSFTLVMLSIAGALALLLGVVGIYGVIAYAIVHRVREIGIRAALGAPPAALKRMFVRQGVSLAAAGIGAGLFVAIGVSRVMSALLFGIGPLDPLTYVAVAIGLILAAALASYAPAARAASVNPIEALRAE